MNNNLPHFKDRVNRYVGTLNRYRHINSLAEAKALYDSIDPLGKKKDCRGRDVRPLQGRRAYARIVKFSEEEYALCQTIVGLLSGHDASYGTDVVDRAQRQIVHTPQGLSIYYPCTATTLAANIEIMSLQEFCFMDRFLPRELSLVRYDNKIYVQIEPKGKYGWRQYLLPRTLDGLRFVKKQGIWYCQNPVKEVTRKVDVKKKNKWLKGAGQDKWEDIVALLRMVEQDGKHWRHMPERDVPSLLYEAIARDKVWGFLEDWVSSRNALLESELRKYYDKIAAKLSNSFFITKVPLGKVCITSRHEHRPIQVQILP